MIVRQPFLILALASAAATAASPAAFHFVSTIQVDGRRPLVQSTYLHAGEVKLVDAGPGLRLEFSAPTTIDEKGETLVRLLDVSSVTPKELHWFRQAAKPEWERTFTYGFCAGRIFLKYPSPKTPFRCADEDVPSTPAHNAKSK